MTFLAGPSKHDYRLFVLRNLIDITVWKKALPLHLDAEPSKGMSGFLWLGAGASVALCAAVGNTLFGWETIGPVVPFTISLTAMGTLLVGIAAASRWLNPTLSAIIVSAIWIFVAGISVLVAPFYAAVLCCAALCTIVSAGDQLTKTINADAAADMQAPKADKHAVTMSRQGVLNDALMIGEMTFEKGVNLVERIHISEQVAVLHDLQDIATGTADQRTRVVMLDVSADDESSRFIDVEMALSEKAGGISIACALVPEKQQPVETPAESHKRILAVASHELRTPLNAIIGFSDVLRLKTFGDFNDPRQEEYVGMIHDAGHDLLALVNTILDVSKIEAGSYALNQEPFNIDKTIAETMRMVEADASRKQLHLTLHGKADQDDYVADRRAFRQVLTNLLSNAVKFTPEGGCIGVELSRVDNGGFAVCVTDTGIGMTDAEIASLFKPFAQVDNAYTRQCEGTGLGLALVKGLVELHGGTLSVVSDTQVGTAITATFPGVSETLVQLADHKPSREYDSDAMAALFKRKAM